MISLIGGMQKVDLIKVESRKREMARDWVQRYGHIGGSSGVLWHSRVNILSSDKSRISK